MLFPSSGKKKIEIIFVAVYFYCMSSEIATQISNFYFKLEILIILSFLLSLLADIFKQKDSFLMEKTSAVKSETQFSREAIEN